MNKKSTQVQKELGKYVKRNTQNRIISRHEITVFPHDFRVKPVIALGNMTRSYFVKEQHKERSSSGKSPIGRQAFNGHIPSASALSLINFITKERRPHKLHYFVVHCSNKFSTCSICGFRKVRKIIGWDTKDRGDMN